MQNLPRITRHLLAAFSGAVLISACAFQASSLTEQEQIEKLGLLIEAGGYSVARQYQIESTTENWLHENQAVGISVVAPTESGTYPLLLYLPGLGENAGAGRLWRENWAKAGYVVFTIQPVPIAEALADLKPKLPGKTDDETVGTDEPPEASEDDPHSPDARKARRALRNSELRYIGHQLFADPSLKSRIGHVLWAYAQFKQRADAGQGLFARADLSHVSIAGYDIGAQTVAALIGEQTGMRLPQTSDFKPQAAILISPSVDPALGNIGHRFRDIKIPFLAITSENDNDPYAISSPQVRTAIWEYAPAGQHYLLLLKNASHRMLSGSGWSGRPQLEDDTPRPDQYMPGFGMQLDGSRRAHRGALGDGMGMPRHAARVEAYQSVAAVFSVSGAFLDSIAKADNFARLWLTENAKVWLDKAATLKIK